MTTPLQKAAQAVIDRWDSPAWKDQPHTADYINELRKALDAEIAQSVEPAAWMTQKGESPAPLYLHPPQPQVTTAVPAGYVLVPIEPTPAMLEAMASSVWEYASYRSMLKAAQGEKP